MGNPNDWNKAIIEEFRANGSGKVGGPFAGATLLLLHTVGAKTQQPRINPVAYTMDADRFVIFASKAGAPDNPDWYYNLAATGHARSRHGEVPGPRDGSGRPERTRLYDQMAAERPAFAEYQFKTTRRIPVIVLTRVE